MNSTSSYAQGTSSPDQSHYPPSPSSTGTIALLGGIFLAARTITEGTPSEIARPVAIMVGIAIVISALFDSKRGLRNLFRTDLLCIIGLYFLTLTEFLFPQPDFDLMISTEQAVKGLNLILVGLAGLAIGRHLIPPKPMRSSWLQFGALSDSTLFKVIIVASFLGYFYKLYSVNFDLLRMFDEMLRPRFAQSWTRARIGGWLSLVTELSLLVSLIPPLTGIVWNRRSFPRLQFMMVNVLFAVTMFSSLAGGTRNVFIGYIASFLIAYLLTLPKNTVVNTILPSLLTVAIALYGSYQMLEFRTVGLRNYVNNQVYASDKPRQSLAVDFNLASLGLIADTIPNSHDYLGMEVLTWAIIRPIPRVFYPGKPEGLSVSIEEIVGAQGWTVAATYVGESYMMAGYWGVIGMSLFFGALAAWWNRLAMQQQSGYAMLVYAIGFLSAGVTMRSMFWLTTLILPILAIVFLKKAGVLR
jgi:hypothetical protein